MLRVANDLNSVATVRCDSNGGKVRAKKSTYVRFAKRVLGWRTPTNYIDIYERLMYSNSTDFDKVISAMYNDGYGVDTDKL